MAATGGSGSGSTPSPPFTANSQSPIMAEMKSFKSSLASSMATFQDELVSKLTDQKQESNIATKLRVLLSCHVCFTLPAHDDNILVAGCCGNILGCGLCVAKFLEDESPSKGCIMCNSLEVKDKTHILRGFGDIVNIMKGEHAEA